MRTTYSSSVSIDCIGIGREKEGNLLILWKENLRVGITSYSSSHISGNVADEMDTQGWVFNGIYGHPNEQHKKQTWALL